MLAGQTELGRRLREHLGEADPEVLSQEAEDAVRALVKAGDSDNTMRSYRSALHYWSAWYALRFRRPLGLPVPAPAVLQFVVDHAPAGEGESGPMPPVLDEALVALGVKARLGPLALATLLHRLSVLSKLHQLRGDANPCQSLPVRELLSRVRRVAARTGQLPSPRPALTREPLEALLATCDDSLAGVRDRALLLFAFGSGGRRRSEVAQARFEQLRPGPQGYVFELAMYKTNQAGERRPENFKPVVGRVAVAMQAWLTRAGIKEGPLFRRLRRGGHVTAQGLSASAVREIVVMRSKMAGLDEPYSAHSLRSGFVSESQRQRIPLAEAMALTGHRSVSTFRGYYQVSPEATQAGRLMEGDPAETA